MIKYIGSKRLLIPRILACVGALPGVRRVLDLFSGTSRVGHALKGCGYDVVSNDHNTFAHVLARCYVQADAREVLPAATRLLQELNDMPPRAGYVTETFSRSARFFHPKNAMRIDAIRAAIAGMNLHPDLEAVCLASLLEAADRVDSTTGVQMAFLKSLAPRAQRDLALRAPRVLPGGGMALCHEAAEAAGMVEVDLAYLDPPYNQHSYRGNYHVWETLARGDEPASYGVVRKRVDCREIKSDFNSKVRIGEAMERVLASLRARHVLVSFNDEGYLTREAMEALLAPHGAVGVFETEFPRYVGARIGIHNPRGERVGRVGRLRNTEFLFVVTPDAADLDRVARALRAPETRVA